MKRIALALLVQSTLFSAAVSVGGATRPKFRPATSSGTGDGRYVITLSEEAATDDPVALRKELALIYGAKLEANVSSDARRFAATMTSARARLLSADSRVIEVVEAPLTTSAPSQMTASSGHIKSRPTGYGDNGQSGTYTYDGAGNITGIGADTYVYDSAQRLVSSVTLGVQENYTYDAYGNRTSATGAVNCLGQTNCAQTVTVDSNTNHLMAINGAAVTYDAAGNIKTIAAISGSPGAVYSYDGMGMMTEATVGSDVRQFIYTANDERIAIKQGVSWTWTLRDQSGKVLREFTSLESGSGPNLAMTNWQWAKDYVWRDGLLLATVTPSGTLHYHLDHLGTPRLITDSNGVKVAEHAYYPFGAEINLTPHESPEEAMKFTGHERDIVAGDGHTLDYMHARYDNASLGRFLSVDPVLPPGALRKPQMWNRYSYVANNPLNRVDPDGKLLQIAGCADTKSQTCQANYNLYLSTFGKQSQDAAKYLQLGKNGIVSFKGISGAAFGSKFGTMGRASDFLISNRAATFSITTDASRVAPNSGGASTRYGNVGAEIAVDLGQFPNQQGGISQTATGALAHELGHALGTLLPGIRDAFDTELGHTIWTMHEGYGTAFENQWRREQGLEQRAFYHYSPGDVGHTSDDVFDWPTPP